MATIIKPASVVAGIADRAKADAVKAEADARARDVARSVDLAATDINAGAADAAKFGSRVSITDIFISGRDCSTREAALAMLRRQLIAAKYQPMPGMNDFFHIDRPFLQLSRRDETPDEAAKVSVVIIADPDSKPATIVPDPTTVCPSN